MAFNVINIAKNGSIKISPKWRWMDEYGDIVKIEEFKFDIENDLLSLEKLKVLLTNQIVVLKNPKEITDGILTCSVFLNEVNIANYFPELNSDRPQAS